MDLKQIKEIIKQLDENNTFLSDVAAPEMFYFRNISVSPEELVQYQEDKLKISLENAVLADVELVYGNLTLEKLKIAVINDIQNNDSFSSMQHFFAEQFVLDANDDSINIGDNEILNIVAKLTIAPTPEILDKLNQVIKDVILEDVDNLQSYLNENYFVNNTKPLIIESESYGSQDNLFEFRNSIVQGFMYDDVFIQKLEDKIKTEFKNELELSSNKPTIS